MIALSVVLIFLGILAIIEGFILYAFPGTIKSFFKDLKTIRIVGIIEFCIAIALILVGIWLR